MISYDRRGCAGSERPEPYERTSVSEHADDPAALLDGHLIDPAHPAVLDFVEQVLGAVRPGR